MISKSDIKYIQSLSHKKFRDEAGLFIVEGVKMTHELLLENKQLVKKLFAVEEWIKTNKSLVGKSIEIVQVEDFELQKISTQKNPQQVIALVSMPEFSIKTYNPDGVAVVLDRLQDPGNLGTIIRTCDWFGVKTIICSTDAVDAFTPKVVQSAMGSILRVNIIYSDIVEFLASHPEVPKYAAVLNGKSIHQIDFKKPCIIIIGNESLGISDQILGKEVTKISIPKYGSAESLNAAIATSIILSNCVR